MSVLGKLSSAGLADRFHKDLSDAQVVAFNSSILRLEMLTRARRYPEWEVIMARNRWFQRKIVDALASSTAYRTSAPRILLSYSYAALEPFRFAKSCGWKRVLVQIDPGPEEERIVAEEAARVPELAGEWRPAPVDYWSHWRQECKLADQIIVNSEWSREGLMRSGIASEKLTEIPLAYEGSELEDQKSNITRARSYPARFTADRPMRVLFLGQVNLRKGISRLLEAAKSLCHEPVEFWIVGPVQIAKVETAADGARVKWFGPVTRREAAEKYRAADIFILPTLSDGFAITQLEAQEYGLPVISTNFCGRVVENGRNGIILEEPSARCIATAIRDCISDPNRLQALASGSFRKDQFTITMLGRRLQDLGSAL